MRTDLLADMALRADGVYLAADEGRDALARLYATTSTTCRAGRSMRQTARWRRSVSSGSSRPPCPAGPGDGVARTHGGRRVSRIPPSLLAEPAGCSCPAALVGAGGRRLPGGRGGQCAVPRRSVRGRAGRIRDRRAASAGCPEIALNQGNAWFRRFDYDQALEHYLAALDTLDPYRASRVQYNLGVVKYRQALDAMQTFQDALTETRSRIEYYRDSLRLDPDLRRRALQPGTRLPAVAAHRRAAGPGAAQCGDPQSEDLREPRPVLPGSGAGGAVGQPDAEADAQEEMQGREATEAPPSVRSAGPEPGPTGRFAPAHEPRSGRRRCSRCCARRARRPRACARRSSVRACARPAWTRHGDRGPTGRRPMTAKPRRRARAWSACWAAVAGPWWRRRRRR